MLCASVLRHCTRTFVQGVMARALRDWLNPDGAWQDIAPTPAVVADRLPKVPWQCSALRLQTRRSYDCETTGLVTRFATSLLHRSSYRSELDMHFSPLYAAMLHVYMGP